jgi:hypothetical protein
MPSESTCPLCFEDYQVEEKSSQRPVTFPCQAQHTLCRQCMMHSLTRNHLCPLCGIPSLVNIDSSFRPSINLARMERIQQKFKHKLQQKNRCRRIGITCFLIGMVIVSTLFLLHLHIQNVKKLAEKKAQEEEKRRMIQQEEDKHKMAQQEEAYFKKLVLGVTTALTAGATSAGGITYYVMTQAAKKIIPLPLHPCAPLVVHPFFHFVCRVVV